MKNTDFKVGDKVYYFDEFERVYVDDEGNRHQVPIYEKKFVEKVVVKVTWKNYYVGDSVDSDLMFCEKIEKENAWYQLFDKKGMEEKIWIHKNLYKIQDAISRRNFGYEKLKTIHEIIFGERDGE